MSLLRRCAFALAAAALFGACGVSRHQLTPGIPPLPPRPGLPPPPSGTATGNVPVQPEEPPAREWVWARGAPANYADAQAGKAFTTGSAHCDARYSGVAVSCTDVSSGKALLSFSDEHHRQAKHVASAVDGSIASVVYFEASEFLIYRLNTSTGAVLERRRVKGPATEAKLVSRAQLEGNSLWYAQTERAGDAGWDTTLRLLDLTNGSVRAQVKLPLALSGWSTHADALYLEGTRGGATSIYAFDKATLKQRFKKALGKDFVYGVTAGPLGLYVQTTTSLFLIDHKDGRELARTAIQTRCNEPPTLYGDQLYVCAQGLEVFSQKLERSGRVELDRWVLHHAVSDAWILAVGRRDLFVIDRAKLRVIARSTTPEDFWIQSFVAFGGRVAIVEAIEGELGVKRRLVSFGPTPAERLDTSALPADARLFEHGSPVGELLPRGRHELDVVRPGYLPVSIALQVTGLAPARIELPPDPFTPVPPALQPPNARLLPEGMEVLELPQRVPTERKLTFGTFGQFALGPLRLGISPEQGFYAVDFTNGQTRSQVELSAFRAALTAWLPPSERNPRNAQEALVGVLPQSRLAIVATRGYRPSILAAFEIDSSRRRWGVQTKLKSPANDAAEYYTQAVTEHAGLVWYHTNDVLYGHDLRDGHLVFEYAVSDREGIWSEVVFDGDFAYLMYKNELIALQLSSRQVAWRTSISGRGFLTLGHDGKRLLFIDKTSVNAYSFAGKLIAKSQRLLGDLDHNPPLILPDAVFLCGDTKNAFYALDPNTLAVRFSMIEPPGDSPCPSYASAHQLALVDGKTAWILDRQSGKLLLKHKRKKRTSANDPEDVFPSSQFVAPSNRGACFMIRRGSVCYE
jgi:hypothetical protein